MLLEINGEIVSQQESEGRIWTLMMVFTPKLGMNSVYEHINRSDFEETAIGEKRVLSIEEIKNSPQEKIAGQWIITCEQMFRPICKDMAFIELRPPIGN